MQRQPGRGLARGRLCQSVGEGNRKSSAATAHVRCSSSGAVRPYAEASLVVSRRAGAEAITIGVVAVGDNKRMVRVLRPAATVTHACRLHPGGTVQLGRVAAGRPPRIAYAVATPRRHRDCRTRSPQCADARRFVSRRAAFAALRPGRDGDAVARGRQRPGRPRETAGDPVGAIVSVPDPGVGQPAAATAARPDLSDFERAIAANEFVPYYQPVVDIRTGRLRGAEVLIRWRKPMARSSCRAHSSHWPNPAG